MRYYASEPVVRPIKRETHICSLHNRESAEFTFPDLREVDEGNLQDLIDWTELVLRRMRRHLEQRQAKSLASRTTEA